MTMWDAIKFQIAGAQVEAHADPYTGNLDLSLKIKLVQKNQGRKLIHAIHNRDHSDRSSSRTA